MEHWTKIVNEHNVLFEYIKTTSMNIGQVPLILGLKILDSCVSNFNLDLYSTSICLIYNYYFR